MSDESQGVAPVLYVFANRSPAPELESLLAMFYSAAYDNRLGLMQAMNSDTEEEEMLLVGVDVDPEGKTSCYPLCRLLAAEDVGLYRAPDGKGGYYNPANPEEVQAVKNEMKPVDESLIDVPLS